ncbi:hypothetical protein Q5P01_011698 [Channa striata]|uniref:C-type lectin domain-containing protein n=1 Tax=Channa striata TaxID=64152 RepID=A0AA88SVY5_CHASR|nr:hypothetical protein Q5P01_011698 [Channa striata]
MDFTNLTELQQHALVKLFMHSYYLAGFGCTQVTRLMYSYVDTRLDFFQAQNYCRENFNDMATITNEEDMSLLVRPRSNTGLVWIGLSDNPKSWQEVMGNDANSWRMSVTGLTSNSTYCNWGPMQPDFWLAKEACVIIDKNAQWIDVNCQSLHMSICFDTNATGKTYVVVSSQLTWTDARTYCRQNHKDLAVIENAEDNKAVRALNITTLAWIGLYREPWTWSDGRNSTFRNFAAGKPDNAQGINHCVAEGPDHFWVDVPCANNLAFFCIGVPKLRTMLRLKIQTDADMTDPSINTQLLQQMDAALMNQRQTDVKLKWKTQVAIQTRMNCEDFCQVK